MNIILDECLPRQLAKALAKYHVKTVQDMGWSGVKNGKLLALIAQSEYHVFVTADQNLQYQQNLESSPICIVVLKLSSLRFADIQPLIPQLTSTLAAIKPGELIKVGL